MMRYNETLCPSIRALFEKDKLVFSFMLCGEIMQTADKITPAEWNFFLRGAAGNMDKVGGWVEGNRRIRW